jgi:antitoxin component YwqK of YwqJK toxin-antitoxin module
MDDPHLKKLKGVYYYDDSPFIGTLFELGSNGDTMQLMTLENGIRNGISKKWWPNGVLKMSANFENDLYEGRVEEWYENGLPYTAFHYKKGKEDGKQKGWEIDGDLKFNYEVIGNRKYGLTGVKHCKNDWVD